MFGKRDWEEEWERDASKSGSCTLEFPRCSPKPSVRRCIDLKVESRDVGAIWAGCRKGEEKNDFSSSKHNFVSTQENERKEVRKRCRAQAIGRKGRVRQRGKG